LQDDQNPQVAVSHAREILRYQKDEVTGSLNDRAKAAIMMGKIGLVAALGWLFMIFLM
jgi:hypothetical protein